MVVSQANFKDKRAVRIALELWNLSGTAELVSALEQAVYRVGIGGKRCYLRLTPPETRTREALVGELDFVHYLGGHGLAVAAPVPSRHGAFIEDIDVDGARLHATTFEEARGETFRYDPHADNRAHFRLRGRMLGRMHALSREHALANPASATSLPRWDADRRLRAASRHVPPSDEVFWSELRELRSWLDVLPTDAAVFGPIHGDFGATNYSVMGDELTLFDFGDACRHWYAYDVAVSVYPYGDRPERDTVLAATLEGYATESTFAGDWTAALTQFCRLRVVYMYLVYADRWGWSSPVPEHARWFAEKRARMRHPVEWHL